LRSSASDWSGKGVDVSFDDELRRAFERKDPPAGFADRVLARISQTRSSGDESRRPQKTSSPFQFRWIAAIAALAVLAVASSQYYSSRQAALEEERVKEQLRVSLQIASEKLNEVGRKVREYSQKQ
jgi:anti-sigma-K factor RskA